MADVCFLLGPFFRQYGIVTASAGANSDLQIGIPSSTNANLYTGALAAGDVKISKDAGAEANIGTLPTQIGATGIWAFRLAAAELQCSTLTIHVKKAGSTAELVITVETRLVLGQMLVDATQVGAANPAMRLLGGGTGEGLLAIGGNSNPSYGIHAQCGTQGGAGLYGDASPTVANTATGISGLGGNGGHGIAGAGNGAGSGLQADGGATGIGFQMKGGTGSGEGMKAFARAGDTAGVNFIGFQAGPGLIANGGATGHGFDIRGGATSGDGINAQAQGGNNRGMALFSKGTGDALTCLALGTGRPTNVFDTLEGSEPITALPNNASFGVILQTLKRRFYNKVTQTIITQAVFRDNSTTILTTMPVSDDGVTQSKGKSV